MDCLLLSKILMLVFLDAVGGPAVIADRDLPAKDHRDQCGYQKEQSQAELGAFHPSSVADWEGGATASKRASLRLSAHQRLGGSDSFLWGAG